VLVLMPDQEMSALIRLFSSRTVINNTFFTHVNISNISRTNYTESFINSEDIFFLCLTTLRLKVSHFLKL
jgi:hypothetical protein